jgi:hypothetical protein
VIVHAQVVIDRLGNMKNLEIVMLLLRQVGDDPRCVGRVISTVVEEEADGVLLEAGEDLVAVSGIRLVPG